MSYVCNVHSYFITINFSAFLLLPHRPLPNRLGLLNTPTAYLERGETPPQTSVLHMTQNNLIIWGSVMLELWGMWSTLSLSSLPGSLWLGLVASDKVLFMGQIEHKWVLLLEIELWYWNYVLMLNWTAWNRIDLTWKLHTYAKLNWLK